MMLTLAEFDVSSLGSAAAAVVVVVLFLKYLMSCDKRDEKRDRMFLDASCERDEAFIKAMERLQEQASNTAKECHTIQRESLTALERSRIALERTGH